MLKNVALNKPATQTSEYPLVYWPASLAVDGSINTFAHTSESGPNTWEVQLGITLPSFSLLFLSLFALGAHHLVSKIHVYARQDCCSIRFSNLGIF